MKLSNSIYTLLLLLSLVLPAGAAESNDYARIQELYRQGRYGQACELLTGYVDRLPYSMRAVPLSDLGTCHNLMGNISEANRAFEEALRYAGGGALRDRILLSYSNNLIDGGAYEKALEQLEAISTREALPHKLINRAHAAYYLERIRPEECVAMLDSCLALSGLTDGLRFVALQNKAFILFETEQYEPAAGLFEEALSIAPDSVAHYRTLANSAMTQARMGRHDKARTLIDAAAAWFKPRLPEEYNICLRKKGEILLGSGQKGEAEKCFREYFNGERTSIVGRLDGMTKQEKLNLWLKEKPLLSKCFMLEAAAPDFLYDVALFRRQTSLLGAGDSMNVRRRLAVDSRAVRKGLRRNGDVAVEFITYTEGNRANRYAALVLPKQGEAKFVKLFPETFLSTPLADGSETVLDAIKSDRVESKNRLYADTLLAHAIWRPILEALPRNTRRLFFAPEGVIHFLGIEHMSLPGTPMPELHRLTTTASLTFEPVAGRHKGALLAGGLNYYSLEADSSSERPDRNASDMLKQRGSALKFEYLPGTRSEVDSLHELVAGSQLWHEAGEHRLKEEMPNFGLVHIATHGYALSMGVRKRPELSADSTVHDISLNLSGLALSGANTAPLRDGIEDGLLSAREICDMDLSGVDFVVLSACQTAQGDIVDEGAAGLVRGLKNAGVPTILATLWSVDDKSTMLFMQEFYRQLHGGKSKYEAFVGARAALREYRAEEPYYKFSPRTLAREKSAQKREISYDEPYYWAPFILIDDAVR